MRLFKNLCLFVVFMTLQLAVAIPEDVYEAAEKGLDKYLKSIPQGLLNEYGFHDTNELEMCKLGNAFEVQMITPQALMRYQENDTVKSLVSNTGMWYFVVTCQGQNRAMLTVAKGDNSNWEVVSLGNIPLAQELQNIQKAWTNDRGFEPQLVVVYQARKYLFHLPQLDDQNITTISLRPTRAVDYVRTESLTSIISNLQEEVQSNIETEQAYLENIVLEETEFPSHNLPGILQVLNVPQVYQKYDQWCWAGCSEAIFRFYGKNIDQYQIAQEGTKGLNIWNWLWGVTSNPYRKGILELLQMGGLRTNGYNSALSLNQLQSEISGQRPFVVRWGWDNGGGHFVVCKGYEGSTTHIMDPWSGPTVNSYNWLRRGNGHTWTSTLTTSR